ncbi:M20/M25/M40 family peptidase [gut metagenome]|uniref:M20/M25/M40 family peptidase n=1 Tax=gut metagenome TaxID=749906 RepID=J9G7L5_9ZZZZ
MRLLLGKKNLMNGTFEIIQVPGKTPALFVDIPAFKKHTGKPAFYYGHFDKQPETLDGWNKGLGPWTPVVQNNRLYGRGSVDDGYSFY